MFTDWSFQKQGHFKSKKLKIKWIAELSRNYEDFIIALLLATKSKDEKDVDEDVGVFCVQIF